MQAKVERDTKRVETKWSITTFMQFYDRVLGDRLFDHFGLVLARSIRDKFRPMTPATVSCGHQLAALEVACGTGQITKHLYEVVTKPLGWKLTATDLSLSAVEVAKQVLCQEILEDVKLQGDVDMTALPFSDASFDVVICGFGLMFPRDKAKAIRAFKRVLRPGAPGARQVYVTVFHANELFAVAQTEFVKNFGNPSLLLQKALSMTDLSIINKLFDQEGFNTSATMHRTTFHLPEEGVKEFLFNSCVLLEEFSQSPPERKEEYLKAILDAIKSKHPSLNFSAEVWLIEGEVTAGSANGNTLRPPNFDELECLLKETQPSGAMESYQNMKAQFLGEFNHLDEAAEKWREQEFSYLSSGGGVYLDSTGSGLPPLSLLRSSFEALTSGAVYGNPHSGSRASLAAYNEMRGAIYRFFNCTSDDYEIMMTHNASGAIKLVAESFPFEEGSLLVLTKDNHTSVHGIREYAKAKGATYKYVTLTDELLLWGEGMMHTLHSAQKGKPNLLAYPAQSNATGTLHEPKWIGLAQQAGFKVFYDAAAMVGTSKLDLSAVTPDYVCISFYKIFGYPTGIGCLLARRDSLQLLKPQSFSGGGVCYISGPWSPTERILYHEREHRFEVGTPNYMAFHSVSFGLNLLSSTMSLSALTYRVMALTAWLQSHLSQLRHDSGYPLVRIYGPPVHQKGATIMLNFEDCTSTQFPHTLVNSVADSFGIILRAGCFCNLGAVQHATYQTAGSEHCEVDRLSDTVLNCKMFHHLVLDAGTCGALRVSFGISSCFRDAFAFYLFAKSLLNIELRALADFSVGQRH